MKKDFKIIPIVFGTRSASTCKKIAEALEPYLNENNLFVISSDFSHYPDYETAVSSDKLSAEAITTKSVKELQKVLETNSQLINKGLQTSMCGQFPIMTLMYMVEEKENLKLKEIQYLNSGDSPYGDHDRVVGYWSLALEKTNTSDKKKFNLTEDEKKNLLRIARTTIEEYIVSNNEPDVNTKWITPNLKKKCGAFVTLHKNAKLRGCIGRFEAEKPLHLLVRDMAISAAINDSRFPEVEKDEIANLDIEISVLTPMKKIESIGEIELGKHGIYIKKGFHTGTFLPQVAKETGWSKEEFLGYCASHKAGIGFDGWKDADIYIYEAIVFAEKDFNE